MMREDGEDMRIFGALGDIVYKITRRELIDTGYLSDAEINYIKVPFDTSGDYKLTYSETYDKHIVNNYFRNQHIINNAVSYANTGRKVLVLISQIDHGTYLTDEIRRAVPSVLYCHGGSKDRYKKLEDYQIIVASNIFNEGIDLPELDVVILGAGGKSSIQLTQRIGRVLRPKADGRKAIVIDFIDDKPKYLKEHYAKRRLNLEEDFKVVEL